MNLQQPVLSAGKQTRTAKRTFASRLFSSRLYYSCCLLVTLLFTAGFGYYKKWWASTYQQVGNIGSFPTVNFTGRLITGDFDKDGDDDILYQAGVDGTPIMFAASNGNHTFASAVPQSASPFRNVPAFNLLIGSTHVKDFDADGDDDVFMAGNNSTGTFLRNDNGTFSSQSTATWPQPQFPGRMVSGDFTGDGNVDFLYQTGADGSAFNFGRNNGDGTFTNGPISSVSTFAGVTFPDMTSTLTVVTDFDKDGDQDIWVPVGGTSGRYFRKDGAAYSEQPTTSFPSPQFPGRVKVADYDADGDPDILYQTGVDGSPFGYYQNNGNGTFSNIGIAASPFFALTLPNLLGTNYNIVDFNADGYFDIYVAANNTQGSYFVQLVPQNAGPWIHFAPNAHNVNVTEDQPKAITGISFSDADAGSASVTVSFAAPTGTWTATAANGVTVFGSGTDSIALNGSIANINTFMSNNNVRFTTAINDTNDLLALVYINDNGNTGAGGPKIARSALSMNVQPVNDAPQMYLPSPINGTEDQPVSLAGIEFADVDAGNNQLTAIFSVSTGTLAATSGGGVTVGGTPTDLTLTGTLGNMVAFLYANSLKYTPEANFTGNVTLGVAINDLGFTGSGGHKITSDITLISIAGINDKPAITLPPSITVTEDVASPVTGISFSDADAGNGSVNVTLVPAPGTLTAVSSSGVTVSGTGSLSLAGTVGDINAFIAGGNVKYTTALNSTAGATLAVSINDNGNTGSGGDQTASANVSINVTPVNDAPLISYPTAQQTDMNVDLVFNAANSNRISVRDPDISNPAVTEVQVTLSVTHGRITLGSLTGLTFTVGDGTADTDLTFRGPLNNVNAALTNLVYSPNHNFTSTDRLIISVNDLGNTGSGNVLTNNSYVALTVNATYAVIRNVQSTNADGNYTTGNQIDVTVTFSREVVVNTAGGTPSILLETGTIDRPAVYISGSGTSTLTFRYTVQSGDNTPDLDYTSTTALTLNGGTIKNTVNDDAILILPAPGGPNSLGGQHNIAILNTSPSITSVNTPDPDTYITSQNLDFKVNFNEPVIVNTAGGTPYLDLTVGSANVRATYAGGTGSNALTFRYVVQSGDLDADGVTLGALLELNGSTIQDGDGNNSDVLLVNIGATSEVKVDAVAPTVTLSTTDTDPVNAPFLLTFRFSKPVQGLSATEIVITNASISGFTKVDGSTYEGTITPMANGPVTVSIPEGAAQDVQGNDNAASGTFTINYDGTAPAVAITSASPNIVSAPFTVTFTFSEGVTGFASPDIAVVNGSVSNFAKVDEHTYTALITPASQGSVSVSVPANKAIDAAGNNNTASNTLNRTFDDAGPTVAISTTAASPVNQPFTVRLDFSEAVSGLIATDLNVTNGTASNVQTTDNITWTVLITPVADGKVTVQLPAATVKDAAGNDNTASPQLTLTYDNAAPTVTLSKTIGNVTNAPFSITIEFSEVVSGFTIFGLNVTNGTASNLQTTDNKTFTALISPTADGLVIVSIPGGIATDVAGNPNAASAPLSVLYDITKPTVDITSAEPDPVRGPFTVTITFSENVNGFSATDLTVNNGSASNFVSVNAKTYTALITPASDGPVSVSVAANKATDAVGNGNTASNTLNRTFDGTGPSVVISTTAVSPVKQAFTIQLVFSEAVTGLAIGDLAITNSTASNLQTSDNITWTVLITPTADGPVTVQLPAATVGDKAGNDNNASNQLNIVYDGTSPAVTLTKTIGNATNAPFTITIQFSEVVNGFAIGDLALTNAASSNLQTTDNKIWTVLVTPVADGPVTASIPAGVATDQATNLNTASNTLSVLYDNTKPSVVITTTATDPVKGPFTITITFSENVNGFTASDINLSNGSISNFVTVDPKTYTALITPVTDGSVTVSVGANKATDAVGNSNTASNTLNRVFDGTPPSVTISTTAANPVNQPFTIQIVFSEAITGLTTSDLTIGNGNASNLQTTDNKTWTALITPTADGPVTVQLPASTAADGAGNANTASNQLSLTYDATPPTVTLSKTVGAATNAPFIVAIRFSEGVNGFSIGDLALTNATAGNLQTTDNRTYTALVTPVSEGTVTVNVPAGVATDRATNPNTAGTALSVLFDVTRPTVAISSAAPDPVRAPFSITITFSEVVNGFNVNDLTVANGSVSDLQTNNDRTFTATVTPAGEGVVSVTVKAGGATDIAGNTNIASATLSRNFDITPPVITVSARNAPFNNVSGPFTAVFRSKEKINGLTLSEITVTNGVASNLVRENEFEYRALITPQFSHELVTVQLPAGSVEDLAGNPNAQSNKLSLMVLNTARVVKVYPVPTRGPLTIQFDGIPARKTKIMIMDMAGRILLTREYEMTSKLLQLHISGIIPGGIYQLVVNNDGNVDRRNIVISL